MIAIARILLITVYHVLSRRVPYRDLGPNYLDERHRNRQIRYHLKRLGEFGITIPSINYSPHHYLGSELTPLCFRSIYRANDTAGSYIWVVPDDQDIVR